MYEKCTPLAKRYALNLVCSAKLRYFFDSQCEKTENFMILPVFSRFFSLFCSFPTFYFVPDCQKLKC